MHGSRPFAGRAAEFAVLKQELNETVSGRGGLVMVAGEPGIGKTRLVQELEATARSHGAQMLWGRSDENSGAPAYWPWVQVGREWGSSNDLGLLEQLPRGEGSELVRLFPELRQVPGFVEPESLQEPEASRFRLFEAYTAFARTAAERRPLVIVLDDLHWADRSTLLLLQHLARDISRMRVLLVCTYRATELGHSHPLSETRAELNRAPGFERVVLRGLSKEETGEYVRQAAGLKPSAAVLDRVYEATGGNPFFLGEVVDLLIREGSVDADAISGIAVPEGAKEALGQRLGWLSEEANGLLQVCAVAGREFTYDTLSLLADRSDEELIQLIEEAVAALVIEEMEQPGRYRFVHALMQETLLEDLSTTRRVRLHGQVAEALERRWGNRAGEYASRLAYHFRESAALTEEHAEKARHYALVAGRAAQERFAWNEAAGWLAAALDNVDEPDAGIVEELSRVQALSGDFRGAWRNFRQALRGYRVAGQDLAFARAVSEGLPLVFIPVHRYCPILEEALERAAGKDPRIEARILMSMVTYDQLGRAGTAIDDLERAIEKVLDREPLAEGLAMRSLIAGYRAERAGDAPTAIDEFRRVAQAYREMGQLPHHVSTLLVAPAALSAAAGDIDGAFDLANELLDHGHSGHLRMFEDHAYQTLASLSHLRADWESFETWASAIPPDLFLATLMSVTRQEWSGNAGMVASLLPPVGRAGGIAEFELMLLGGRARALLLTGDRDGAATEFERWASLWESDQGLVGQRANALAEVDVCLVEFGDTAFLQRLYDEVRFWPWRTGPYTGRGLDAVKGAVAFRLDLVDDADQIFRGGLMWAEEQRCPVEAGRCLQGLAEVAERRGRRDEAIEALDQAVDLFQRHGTTLFLKQAIARKDEISRPGGRKTTHPRGLTAREVEVLCLLARGKRNREIAEELAVSPATVTRHVSNIFDKTGFSNRTELVSYALRQGLLPD